MSIHTACYRTVRNLTDYLRVHQSDDSNNKHQRGEKLCLGKNQAG